MYMKKNGDKKGAHFAFLLVILIIGEWRITWMGVNGSNECEDCY